MVRIPDPNPNLALSLQVMEGPNPSPDPHARGLALTLTRPIIGGHARAVGTDWISAVRYAMIDEPQCVLYNSASLPALPFQLPVPWERPVEGASFSPSSPAAA